ncbi:NAD(P)H-dependent glycerol-3-phosphate dehydrogenase [Mesorhizobium sp. ASY16-5R]|uniref:NAD(P)H-dependent glycerol-3-phosphate dehydrogenase n=1 Tax=Mesorhizobium sp. ASY16-5R TaxID=3445772 RepID=UPI003FA04F8A
MSRLAILGGGAWGTALALTALRAGHGVSQWAREAEAANAISAGGNPRYLPGMAFEAGIEATTDIGTAVSGAEAVLAVVPAQSLRVVLAQAAPSLSSGLPLVLCAKGIEGGTGKLLSEVAAEICPANPCATLSGPSFATDVARGMPTAVVIAARSGAIATDLAALLSTRAFRCYSTSDQTGVEIGGALKNVLAIAAGATLGAGLGASAQAALVTRGFVELRRIGAAFGAQPETLMGLSGLGDLLLTCASAQSRNFAYGLALGRGEALAGRPLAEGVATAGIAARIAVEKGVEAPIIAATAHILAGRLTIAEAVESLMSRPLKSETD